MSDHTLNILAVILGGLAILTGVGVIVFSLKTIRNLNGEHTERPQVRRGGYPGSAPAEPPKRPLSPGASSPQMVGKNEVLRTKTGRELTNEDFEALADEAERGYDIEHLRPREVKDE